MKLIVCGVTGFLVLALFVALILTIIAGIAWLWSFVKLPDWITNRASVVNQIGNIVWVTLIGGMLAGLLAMACLGIGEATCHTFHFFGH